MVAYYADLFFRALLAIPNSLGSNAFGLVWPVIVVIFGEMLACFFYGWRTVMDKWKNASLIGFAALGICYTLLFAGCALITNYRDHAGLISKVDVLQRAFETSTAHEEYAVLIAKGKCAETVGANSTLTRQNRDQQNTINHCQEEALKLLVPEQQKIVPLLLEKPLSSIGDNVERWLVVTNKTFSPIDLLVTCTVRVETMSVHVIGAEKQVEGSQDIGRNTYEFRNAMAAWGPQSPLLATIKYHGGPNHSCSFTPR